MCPFFIDFGDVSTYGAGAGVVSGAGAGPGAGAGAGARAGAGEAIAIAEGTLTVNIANTPHIATSALRREILIGGADSRSPISFR